MIRNLLNMVLILSLLPALGANNALTNVKNRNETDFTQNLGQIVNEQGEQVPDVLAKASIPGMDLYITKTGATYVLLQYEEDLNAVPHPVYFNEKKYKIKYSRIDVELSGAWLSSPQMQFSDELGWKSNYYKSADGKGQENVSHFKTLTIQNVYPGIDWIWKINASDKLEYDFVVHPGGDASLIKMKYNYADIKTANDRIILSAKNGSLTEGPLKASCENKGVDIRYQFNADLKQITFNTGKYDVSKDLVIDPPLSLNWSALYGGAFQNGLRGVSTDNKGFVYLTGYTNSANFPTLNRVGATYYDSTFNGQSDAIILKLDTAQNLKWSTYFGGPGNDFGNSIYADTTGNIYVTGGAQAGFPLFTHAGGYNQSTCTGQDAFIARFSSSLALQWSTFYGGNGTDEGLKIYQDNSSGSGSLYVTGYTTSTGGTFPTLGSGGYIQTAVTGNEAFILKFSGISYSQQWATVYGGSGDDFATSVTTDTLGNAVVTGFTGSTNLPVQNGGGYYQGANAGGTDGFILKFNPATQRTSATYYGGRGSDYITDIATGLYSSFEFTGRTNSTNFPIDSAHGFAYNQTHIADSSSYDAFVVKCLNDMSLSWSTYYGGSALDAGTGITTDKSGQIYVTGFTFSTNFPVKRYPGAYFQATNRGNADGFIARFSNQGVRSWSTYKGDTCFEYPNDIAYDNRFNKFYVAGEGLLACNALNPDSGGQSVPNPGQVSLGGNSSIGFCWAFNGQSASCVQLSAANLLLACPGKCNGKAQVSLSGGTLPYSVIWSNGSTSSSIDSGLCAGQNWVEAVDSNGCEAEATLVSDLNLIVSLNTVGITCRPGSVTATVTGGNPVYTYQWSTGPTSPPNVADGFFNPTWVTVTVTDQNTCSVTADTLVDYNNSNNVWFVYIDQYPICNNTGSVSIGFPGSGPTDLGVLGGGLNGTPGSNVLTGVQPNQWYVLYDYDDCINGQPTSYGFSVNDEFSAPGAAISYPTSCTTPDGSISVYFNFYLYDQVPGDFQVYQYFLTAGTPNITYLWSNGSTNPSISNLRPGTYTVTATDQQGLCDTVMTFYLPDPPNPIISVSNITEPCPGRCNGSAKVNIGGGTSPYSILWSGGGTTVTTNTLCTGSDSVRVTDAVGCFARTDFATRALSISISNETDITCSPGSASALATAGNYPLHYKWSDSTTGTLDNNISVAGYVYVTATDANNCTASSFTYVNYSSNYNQYSFTINQFPDCNGQDGSATFEGFTGNVSWSDPNNGYFAGGNTAYGLSTNTGPFDYYIITDSSNCYNGSPIQYHLYLPADFDAANISGTNPTNCGTAANNGNVGVTVDAYTSFYLSSTDGFINSITTAISPGALPAFTYLWSDSSTGASINPAGPGDYHVTISDGLGCSLVLERTLVSSPVTPVLNVQTTDVSCYNSANGAISTVAIYDPNGGPYHYLWSNGDTGYDVSNLSARLYTVTVTDAGQCSASFQYLLSYAGSGYGTIHNFALGSCQMNNIYADVIYNPRPNTGTTYNWSNGRNDTFPTYRSDTLFNVAPGTYSVLLKHDGTTDNVCIVIPAPDTLKATIQSTTYNCTNNNAQAIITGGTAPISILWSTGDTSQILSRTFHGLLNLKVSDQNGCVSNDTTAVTIASAFTAGYITDTIKCYGDSAHIYYTATGGFQPYTGTGLYKYPSGTYSHLVSDSSGCQVSESVNLAQPAALLITVTAQDTFSCLLDSIQGTIIATGGTPPYTGTGTHTFTQSGYYTLSVTDNNGCRADSLVNIYISPDSTTTFAVTDSVCDGGQIIIPAGSIYNYTWYPGNSQDSVYVIAQIAGDSTVYIKGTGSNGCLVADTFHIAVKSCISTTANELADNRISVYPNPAADEFFVHLDKPSSTGGEIKLYTVEGKLVLLNTIAPGENLKVIDCSKLASAVYVLRATLAHIEYYYKVVVDR